MKAILKEELSASEIRYRRLFESAKDGILILDAETGRIVDVNPFLIDLLGYSKKELIEKTIWEIGAFQDIFENKEKFMELQQEEYVRYDDLPLETADGRKISVEFVSNSYVENKEKVIQCNIRKTTIQRQSELELRKSESYLRTLLKTIPDLIWLKDTYGLYLLCNPMFERFFGAREKDIIGKTDHDFVDLELADLFRENDRKAMEAGKPTSNEEWVTFADDGHRAFLDTIKSPIYDSDGTLHGVLGIGRDITERMLAGQKLQASETRFRTIFDQAPIAIALIDLEGHPIISNVHLSKMLGYTKAELSKMTFTEFTYPEDIDKDLNQFTDLIAGKISGYKMEKRYIHKNGNLIWANLFVTALNDNNGVSQEIIGMVEDISEQKKIQNEIKFQADLINNVGQAVIATDLSSNVIYWNNAAEKIYGWSSAEAIGQNITSIIPTESTREQDAELIKKLSEGDSWAGEFLVKRKDGTSFPAFVTNTPILDSKGELTGIIGISSDITERKLAEMELINAKEKAEESDRLKSAFLANMSHEIRTPMNGILGFTELLLESDLNSEQKEKYIKIVQQSGQRMLSTVNDIIEISKIEAGLVQLNLTETDVNGKIEELFRFFQPEADKKGIKLSIEMLLPLAHKCISTDQNKLDSILTNLIKNAIKYTNSGTIQLGCRQKEDAIEFYVKDTGIGIPKQRQKAVFERFMQADIADTRAFQGSGLGLAISKSYVSLLGGKIWVESREGKGSIFYFTLPLNHYAKEKTVVWNEITLTKEPKKGRPASLDLKIVIAEDNEISRDYISLIVRDFAKEILVAETGIEAIELCRNNKDIDLILMDIKMPDLDGYEATHRIREFNKDVVIIAQTAFALSGDREKAMDAGCNDYIAKPIKREALIQVVKKHFNS